MLIEQFRLWYQHECDCNAKIVTMIRSVPETNQTRREFSKVLILFSHLILARKNWIHRLQTSEDLGIWVLENTSLSELELMCAEIQESWTAYLEHQTDETISERFNWSYEDKKLSWIIAEMLAQLNGHSWYHRGQIAQLVDLLGGEVVDTDFVFWTKGLDGWIYMNRANR